MAPPNDEKRLACGVERARKAAFAAGAVEVDTTPLGPAYKPPAWHLLYYVRVEDPLPAGADAVDPTLLTTSQLNRGGTAFRRRVATWPGT